MQMSRHPELSLKPSNVGESFVLKSSIFPLQYLGFGMPANSSKGRRAAQASAAPMDDDQLERDANLKKVQAKDLVEFGMIPVSRFDNTFQLCNLPAIISKHSIFLLSGIRWPFPGARSVPQSRCGHVGAHSDRAP